jgi:polyhydroxybutyrate depolymerase
MKNPFKNPRSGSRYLVPILVLCLVAVYHGVYRADVRAGLFFHRNSNQDEGDAQSGLVKQTITVAGTDRIYYLHRPEGGTNGKVPLVMMFHGGRGTGDQAAKHTGFNQIADKHGFVVVYPQSTGNWRDGRSTTGEGTEDLQFVHALINHLVATANVDPKRVYATGISNGGIFTLRLACDMDDEIAAFAPVAASMPVPYKPKCHPSRPVPLMLIHGSDDQFIPYNGGAVKQGRHKGAGGYVISIPDTVDFWRQVDGCSSTPADVETKDTDKDDETQVVIESYGGCKSDSALTVINVKGGGHTWPGSPYTQSAFIRRIVGRTTRDISGSEVIWKFFSRFSRP